MKIKLNSGPGQKLKLCGLVYFEEIQLQNITGHNKKNVNKDCFQLHFRSIMWEEKHW